MGWGRQRPDRSRGVSSRRCAAASAQPSRLPRQADEAASEEEGGGEFWNGDCCWDRGQRRSRAGTATFACKLTPPPDDAYPLEAFLDAP